MNDDKSTKITQHICSCKLACVSIPMLMDLILVEHFRMRRDRKRRSAAALAINIMVIYKVYRRRLI